MEKEFVVEKLKYVIKMIEAGKIHPISFQMATDPSGFDSLHHKFTVECYEKLNIMQYSADGFSLKYIVGIAD